MRTLVLWLVVGALACGLGMAERRAARAEKRAEEAERWAEVVAFEAQVWVERAAR